MKTPHEKQKAAVLSLTDKPKIVAALPTAGRTTGVLETRNWDVRICRQIKRTRLGKDGITQLSASSIGKKSGRYTVKLLIDSKVKKRRTSGLSPKRSSGGSRRTFLTTTAKSTRPKNGARDATS